MKKIRIFTACAMLLAGLSLAPIALAYGPYLSTSVNGGNVVLSVNNAYPNSSIQLNYTVLGSTLPTTVTNFGYTDGSGNFSTTVSGSTYGIVGGAQVYVTVGGQISNTVTVGNGSGPIIGGCGYYGCGGTGSFPLSQTNVSVAVGQTAYVTASNNSGSSLYISSNSNQSAVSASVSGSQISLYGMSQGSATVSVCSYSYGQCASIYVTVGSGSSGSGSLSLSQTSLSLSAGQSQTVSIYNYGSSFGNYYISSNSNPSAATASISGSSLYVSASNAGSASIVVCQSSYSCATLFVTVSGVLGSNTNLWFSPGSPSLYVGQSLAVSINSSVYSSGAYPYASAAYYISSNSNPSAVSANVSGTVLNLYANQSGSSNITVCSSGLGFCGTLAVTVGGGSSGTGTLSFSPSSPSLASGQSLTVSVYNNYGSYGLYVASNSNPNAVSASVSGMNVTLYGYNYGNSTINICTNGSSQCGNLYVTVTGSGYGGNISITPSTLSLGIGQSASASVYGPYSGNFTISNNSNPTVASAVMQGATISVTGTNSGFTTFSICQSGSNTCGNLGVTVNNSYGYYGYGSGSLPYSGGYGYSGGGVLGASLYSNGSLISENGTVYIVYRNTKAGFVSASVFSGFGFSFNNVVFIGNSGLGDSGYTIRSSSSSHPWGSWVKSGSTVYFVHESGLIPVGDYTTFLNNGGRDNLVVRANSWDFQLPMLSVMISGDPRLR